MNPKKSNPFSTDALIGNKEYEKFMSEYERGLLALALKNFDILTDLKQKISTDYFLYPPHKLIYTALCNLVQDTTINHIDVETLDVECRKLGLQGLGVNTEYLILLSQGGFDKSNYTFYFNKVKNAYLKFLLFKKLEDSKRLVEANAKDSETTLNSEQILDNISSEISNIIAFNGVREEAIEVSERVEEFVKERAEDSREVIGVRTGISSLDIAINGLLPGTLTIVAGMAKAGKSTVLMNMVDYIAIESDNTIPILVISTEMYTDEDISRLIAMRCMIDERKIFNGIAYNDPKQRIIVEKAIRQIQNAKIYHIYLPDFNAAKICNLIYHFKLKYNIGLAIFDYIKMSTLGTEFKDKREDQILGDITTALKNIAGKLHIPVVTACQVNTRTGLIADSDRIARYANTLIEFRPKTIEELQEQDYYKHGTHWLHVFKTRAGGNIKIPIRFWKKCLKIQEAEFFIPEESNEEEIDPTEELLTTPEEYQNMKNQTFKLDIVKEVLETKDAYDLKLNTEQNTNKEEDDEKF
jgi:replicative DNA helicase